jgi:phage gpG-like protein
MSYDITDWVNKMNRLERIYKNMPSRAATIAVNFSKNRFREQAWVDDRTEPWRRRKDQSKKGRGRAILVSSGRLKRSIRKIRIGPTVAVIGTDVPYARGHNFGFKGQVSVKGHKRGKFKNVKQGTGVFSIKSKKERTRSSRQATGETSSVKSFTRNVTLPRRQFLGESRVLAQQIERDIVAQVMSVLKS